MTFTRPTAKVLAANALLAAKPFAMRAEDAPEPRDVIWQNVYVGVDSVRRRQWMVNLGVFALMLFWTGIPVRQQPPPEMEAAQPPRLPAAPMRSRPSSR